MTRAYRRVARPSVPGVELSEHDNLSRALYMMRQQATGIRGTLRQATGRGSRLSQAAVALVEAIGHLQEVLLAEHDAAYGAESHPMLRTRYT